ncbi:hypothetical protein B0H16DRAFT_1750244 [Mycena metata]|uniref:Uncharacterized protein n=1 Tax=Mycena metata TaxID=1033252 RepID=A0AAD7GIP7_9AGAR|nr:hypothetical protein B0H16DRAFT_1750244 [Mycena metata]
MDSDLANPNNATTSTSAASLSSPSTNSAVPTVASANAAVNPPESSTASSSLQVNSAVDTIPASCVFSMPRLRSYHGYRNNPPVNFGLDYRLPEFKSYHSRVVQIGERQYLIWSPNSLQDPFYPRPYDLNGQINLPTEPAQRESQALETDVEYAPVYSVWRDEPGNPKEGRLLLSYVEKLVQRNSEMDRDVQFYIGRLGGQQMTFIARRPIVPTTVQLLKLRGIREYQEAVDVLVELQRGMREKGVWLDMVNWLLHQPMHPEGTTEVLPANERCIGVWINDADREDCFWYLLRGAVPCFVIHLLPEAERVTENVCLDFFSRTEIEEYVLDARQYPADQIAFRERYRYTATEYHPIPHATLASNPGGWADLRALLRIWANEVLPRDRPRKRKSTDERNLLNRRRIMGAMTSPSDTPTGIQFARETRELQDKVLRAKAVKEAEDVKLSGEVNVDPAHAPWLRPPEIIQAGPGAWTTYREQDDEETGTTFMLELGKKNDHRKLEAGDVMYWDRANNRWLIFEGSPSMPAGTWLTTGREFGRPVPKWPFKNVGHKELKEERWSKWMYASETPHPADVGDSLSPLTRATFRQLLKGSLRKEGANGYDATTTLTEESLWVRLPMANKTKGMRWTSTAASKANVDDHPLPTEVVPLAILDLWTLIPLRLLRSCDLDKWTAFVSSCRLPVSPLGPASSTLGGSDARCFARCGRS